MTQPLVASVYQQELEQDPFDPDDFVERLVWRLTGGEVPDAANLHRTFEQEIQHLQLFSDKCQGTINKLNNQCMEEEEDFHETLERLQNANKGTEDRLSELGERINAVSAKVVHLGDQLESVNAPRARAFEALQLMRYFNEFMSDQPLESELFTDPDRILEAGEIICKLHSVAQELQADKFKAVQDRIQFKYDELEKLLIDRFVRAHKMQQRNQMRRVVLVLANFKGYKQVEDAFVEECQVGQFKHADVFDDIVTLWRRTFELAMTTFPNGKQVMQKLLVNIFQGKLTEYVTQRLDAASDLDVYLSTLFEVYSKTGKMLDNLKEHLDSGEHKMKLDEEVMRELPVRLFGSHLEKYMDNELKHLNDRCKDILQRYYDSQGHLKKVGRMQDWKREMESRLLPESHSADTLLSEEVAISILQETKLAFQRVQLICQHQKSVPSNTGRILQVLLQYLCTEHIDYGVDLAFYSIPASEPKTVPQSHFLNCVSQTNSVCHLLEKQFQDSVVPLVQDSPEFEDCLAKKRKAMANIEAKLNNGLDRLLTALIAYMRYVLRTEQKASDFKDENENDTAQVQLCTPVCNTICKLINEQVEKFKYTLDGQNLEFCMTEFGARVHRCLLDHIYS